MSAETAHTLYTILAFALGWTCHLGWRMLVDYHDARKNHEIHRLQWECDQLKHQLAEAPAPLEDADAAPEPIPMEPVTRHRRSPVKAENLPVQPLKMDTAKVQRGIPQAELGRMQAQLSTVGRCRTIYAGGTKR